MKYPFLITLIINSILWLQFDLVAQQIKGISDDKITNAEPIHAHFRLEDIRTIPITLNRLEANIASYSYNFQFLSHWKDEQVFVRFEKIDASYFLKINGFNYGAGSEKIFPSEFNITPFLNQGSNTIELEFDQEADSQDEDLSNAGMLIIREPVHVRDILVTSYDQDESSQTLIRINLYIQSFLTERSKDRTLTMTLFDPAGTTVASQKKYIDFPLAFRQEAEFTFDQPIEDPLLWSPDDPALYSVQLNLVEDGQLQGELVSTTFGLRSAIFKDSILVINHDTVIPKIIDYQLQIEHFGHSNEEVLKLFTQQGYNSVQTNEPIPARLMELFDRQGIVVLKKEVDRDPDLDRPDQNRPSVVWIE